MKPSHTPLQLTAKDLSFARLHDAFHIVDFCHRPIFSDTGVSKGMLLFLGTHPDKSDFLQFAEITTTKQDPNNNNSEKNTKVDIQVNSLGRTFLQGSFSQVRWGRSGVGLNSEEGDIHIFKTFSSPDYDFSQLGREEKTTPPTSVLMRPYGESGVYDFQFKFDGQIELLSASYQSKDIAVWDVENQKIANNIQEMDYVLKTEWHPVKSLLGYMDESATVRLWDIRTKSSEIFSQCGAEYKKNMQFFLFNPEEEDIFLTTNGKDGHQHPVIQLWDMRKPSLPFGYLADPYSRGIKSVSWYSKNSALILLSTADSKCLSINPFTEQLVSRIDINSYKKMEWSNELAGVLTGHTTNGGLHTFDLDNLINAEPEIEESSEAKPVSQSEAMLQSLRFSFPFEVAKLPHFDLEKLMSAHQGPNEDILSFAKEMKLRSFAMIKLPPELKKTVDEIWETSRQFFDLPLESKEPISILPWRDIGYMSTKGVKEFWQMRKSECTNFPWPDPQQSPKFKQSFLTAFDQFQNVGRALLGCLAHGMQIPPKILTDMMDLDPPPSKESFSNSILSVYLYYKNEKAKESCDIHKDMGMITLVPTAMVPGLQVLDYDTLSWVEIEKIARSDEVVCFASETIERATAGFYSGCIHRVVREYDSEGKSKERASIVHKVRSRTDAWFDCQNLNSPVLTEIPLKFQEKVLARDYIKKQLSTRESVNFPSKKGFVTYANCILDPDRNGSEDYYQKTQAFNEEDIQHRKDYQAEEEEDDEL